MVACHPGITADSEVEANDGMHRKHQGSSEAREQKICLLKPMPWCATNRAIQCENRVDFLKVLLRPDRGWWPGPDHACTKTAARR